MAFQALSERSAVVLDFPQATLPVQFRLDCLGTLTSSHLILVNKGHTVIGSWWRKSKYCHLTVHFHTSTLSSIVKTAFIKELRRGNRKGELYHKAFPILNLLLKYEKRDIRFDSPRGVSFTLSLELYFGQLTQFRLFHVRILVAKEYGASNDGNSKVSRIARMEVSLTIPLESTADEHIVQNNVHIISRSRSYSCVVQQKSAGLISSTYQIRCKPVFSRLGHKTYSIKTATIRHSAPSITGIICHERLLQYVTQEYSPTWVWRMTSVFHLYPFHG